MHVPRTELWYREQIGRQDPAIGDNHEQIGRKGCQIPREQAIAQLGRLQNRKAEPGGKKLHGGRLDLRPAARWPVGLGDDGDDLMALCYGS